MNIDFDGKNFHFSTGGTSRGKTAAAKDWANMMEEMFKSEFENAHAWSAKGEPSTPLIMKPIKPDFKSKNRHKWAGWTAPAGYNNYLTTGNFIGCRPIIKPGAKVNARVFEPLKFEMV